MAQQPPPGWGEESQQPPPDGTDLPTQAQSSQSWGQPPQVPPTQTALGAVPPPPPRPPRQWYQRPEILIPLGLVVFLTLGAGLYAATKTIGHKAAPTTTTQEQHVITGTFTLSGTQDEDFTTTGSGCEGMNGYDDVEPGLQVTISDQSGTVIGNGTLDSGEAQEGGCVFRFQVNKIPVANFYKVAVGRRGEISYSLEQMKQASWSVELSLGD